jgi:hypothetical protein
MDNPRPGTPPASSAQPQVPGGSADAPSTDAADGAIPVAPPSERPGLIPLPSDIPQRTGFSPSVGGSRSSTPAVPSTRRTSQRPSMSGTETRGFSTPEPDPSRAPAPPPVDLNRPLPVVEASGPSGLGGKITAFGGQTRRHEDSWVRTPNTTGSGAIHVKTFHCKLTDDALAYLDQTINEWLDAHPQYEVKFVSSAIGILTGKLKEPALICQVWV